MTRATRRGCAIGSRDGVRAGFDDIAIAAIAEANELAALTRNLRDFDAICERRPIRSRRRRRETGERSFASAIWRPLAHEQRLPSSVIHIMLCV